MVQSVGVQLAMMVERVGGGVGGAEQFDLEALQQRARRELWAGQLRLQVVVDSLRALTVQSLIDAE
jgi:hypothetical protein